MFIFNGKSRCCKGVFTTGRPFASLLTKNMQENKRVLFISVLSVEVFALRSVSLDRRSFLWQQQQQQLSCIQSALGKRR